GPGAPCRCSLGSGRRVVCDSRTATHGSQRLLAMVRHAGTVSLCLGYCCASGVYVHDMDSALAALSGRTAPRDPNLYLRRAGIDRTSPRRRPSPAQHGAAGGTTGSSTTRGAGTLRDRRQCTQPSDRRLRSLYQLLSLPGLKGIITVNGTTWL